jgi:hypothetical protein
VGGPKLVYLYSAICKKYEFAIEADHVLNAEGSAEARAGLE